MNPLRTKSLTTALLLAALLVAPTAWAGDTTKESLLLKDMKAKDLKQTGWDVSLSIGATLAVAQSSNVVGRIDGTSFTFGANLKAGLNYIKAVHEWRNKLLLTNTFTRTPALDVFAKTNDIVSFDSIYLYKLKAVPWLGPFARAQLDTTLFPGYDFRAAPTDYVIDAGTANARVFTSDQLRLTDPFSPLTLRQSIGVFAKPLSRTWLNVEIKAGFGARETFADGQLALADDDATANQVEVKALSDFAQGGPVGNLLLTGTLSSKRVSYSFEAEVFVPVIKDSDKSAGDLTNVLFDFNISFKLVSWASLDYQFKAVRDPQLVDHFQIQNNLLLTFAYTLLESDQGKKKAKK
ncbi:MAG: DUF3078 domain-containing protein [Myxococcales bacterium]|nr:DUF3078 domain-containing protein [Myxococcales bacterium]